MWEEGRLDGCRLALSQIDRQGSISNNIQRTVPEESDGANIKGKGQKVWSKLQIYSFLDHRGNLQTWPTGKNVIRLSEGAYFWLCAVLTFLRKPNSIFGRRRAPSSHSLLSSIDSSHAVPATPPMFPSLTFPSSGLGQILSSSLDCSVVRPLEKKLEI